MLAVIPGAHQQIRLFDIHRALQMKPPAAAAVVQQNSGDTDVLLRFDKVVMFIRVPKRLPNHQKIAFPQFVYVFPIIKYHTAKRIGHQFLTHHTFEDIGSCKAKHNRFS